MYGVEGRRVDQPASIMAWRESVSPLTLIGRPLSVAAPGDVQFVRRWLIDHPNLSLQIADERDGDAEMRNAARKIGSAVDRIDDPNVAAEIATRFFSEKRILRECRDEPFADHALHLRIRIQDVILRSLEDAHAGLWRKRERFTRYGAR